jgi:signal transduction histidine kinase/CheY-like chemotaxis protein
MSHPPIHVSPREPAAHGEYSREPLPGGLASWCGSLVDAQARRIRDLEQRLAERTRVLTDAAQALAAEIRRRESAQAALIEAQRLEAIGHMAGGMVHDLRNVLGVAGVGYEIFKLKTADQDLHRLADSGSRALGQANGLIESLLGLIRRQDDEAVRIEAGDWLAQMAILVGYAAGRHATCRVEAAPDAWAVRVVEHRLGAALMNLAANARDALPAGGEAIAAVFNLPRGAPRPGEIPDGDFVVFSVSDSGCGMSPDVVARSTDPLFSTKPRGEGTGLGLAMVRDFARSSGGYLHIVSAPGCGTRVELYLPRCLDSERLEAASCSAVPTSVSASGAGSRRKARAASGQGATHDTAAPIGTLMLVDGDDLARASLTVSLRAVGWEVVESTSAEVALALLHTRPRLDLLVTDLDLPGGSDGLVLVRRLRLERPGLPAVLLTARSAPAGASLAGVPLVEKSLDRDALQGVLCREMAKSGSRREAQDALLDRLLLRVRSPALLVALLGWRELRGSARLPGLAAIERAVPDLRESIFVAEPEGPADTPTFRLLSVGSALTRQLGRSIDGEIPGASGDGTLDGLAIAYRRASRTGLPTYEYARYALDEGPPVRFERLIVPASRDGESVSHLLGIVLFGNLA